MSGPSYGREVWSIDPHLRIFSVGNDDGAFEIALQEYDVAWFLDELGRPRDEPDPRDS